MMVRDVEVLHAEREVDRVEIFEGGRERRKVGREKHGSQEKNRREMQNAECRMRATRAYIRFSILHLSFCITRS